MVRPAELKYLFKVAEDAARSASKAIEKDLKEMKKIEADYRRDVKVAADKKLEKFIISCLRRKSSFPILSEESATDSKERCNGGYRWLVDPLDGSLNFSRGIPFCAISIAFWQDMKPLFGLVHDFNRGETFTGLVSEGAWFNGRKIKIGKVRERSKAVLCTGFPVETSFSEERLVSFVKDVAAFKKVRLFGSAALSLAYVACGRADFYKEDDIRIWDVAAGLAIVKAAGGLIEISPSGKRNVFRVKAANKSLFRKSINL